MHIPKAHVDKAIEQIQHKQPPPNIDFTQHVLEDGNTISTQERVIKDVGTNLSFTVEIPTYRR
jgi:serine/threonine-protein phosphatase 2B catalytic subunit